MIYVKQSNINQSNDISLTKRYCLGVLTVKNLAKKYYYFYFNWYFVTMMVETYEVKPRGYLLICCSRCHQDLQNQC